MGRAVKLKNLKVAPPESVFLIKSNCQLLHVYVKLLDEWQTVETQTRLLQQEESGLGLLCLLRHTVFFGYKTEFFLPKQSQKSMSIL